MTTEDTTPKTTSTSSKPPVKSAVMKAKPPVVGKIQGKSFKVAPLRINNSSRGR